MPDVKFALFVQRFIRMRSVHTPGEDLLTFKTAFLGFHHVLMMIIAASWVVACKPLLTREKDGR